MRARTAVLLVLILLILAAGTAAALLNTAAVLDALRPSLAADLSQQLGCQVAIGRLDVERFTVLAAYDVRVADSAGSEMLRADKVTVSVAPLRLLLGHAPVEAVREIAIASPRLHLFQRPDGTWNIEDLQKKPRRPEGPEFTGRVLIDGGEAVVDRMGSQWTIDHIEGQLDFLPEGPFSRLWHAGANRPRRAG